MFYIDLMVNIWKRLKELSKLDFPKYKDWSAGEFSPEYKEEQDLINQYHILQDYDKKLYSMGCVYMASQGLKEMFAVRGVII